MPAPTCQCSICGETVLKAQTYHVGGGKRACKKHEGVIDQAHKAQDDAKAAEERKIKEKEQRDYERRRDWMQPKDDAEAKRQELERQIWGWCTCWTCGRTGLQLSELYKQRLIGMERLDLKHIPFNLFDANQVWRETDLPEMKKIGLVALRRIVVETEAPGKMDDIMHRVRRMNTRNQATIIPMIGVVQMCPECCEHFGIKFVPDLPELTIEKLLTAGAVYDVFMRPAVRAVAEAELDEEAKRN